MFAFFFFFTEIINFIPSIRGFFYESRNSNQTKLQWKNIDIFSKVSTPTPTISLLSLRSLLQFCLAFSLKHSILKLMRTK